MIAERLSERMGPLRGRERAGVAALAVLVLAGAVFWYMRSLPRPVTISTVGGPGSPRAAVAAASPSPSPQVIYVHVAGRVRHPGVYELHQGDRVIDAIRAAGGARSGADLTTINLAALLTDGEQVLVSKVGKPGGAGGGSVISGGGAGSEGGPPALVNLNTATLDQLETLPGIGPALGQRIIDYREQHGPFGSVDELLNVSGIGDKRLEDLRPLVTV